MTEIYGFNDWMGIDVEATEGTAVKATTYLDLMSSSFGQKVETLFRRSMRQDGRLVKRIIPRNSTIDGDVQFEVPCEQIVKIFKAAFGAPDSSGTSSPYTHVFKNPTSGTGHQALTVVQSWGGYYRIATGAVVNKLSARAAIDQPFTMTMSLSAIDMGYGDTGSVPSGWVSSPAYDSVGNFEDYHIAVTYDSTAVDTIDDVTIDTTMTLTPKRALTGSRRPVKHMYGISDTEIRLNMYFSSDKEMLQLLGHSTFPGSYPKKITASEQPKVVLKVEAAKTSSIVYKVTADIADMRITEIGAAEYIEDVIKVPLTFRAMYDNTATTDIKWTCINSVQTIANGVAATGLPTDFGPSTAAARKI